MPNVKDIAATIARGMFGEQWDAAKARRSELESAAQRRSLLEAAEGRAVAGEGREAERFQHGKSMWGDDVALSAARAKGAGLEVTGREQDLAARQAAGGPEAEGLEVIAGRQRAAAGEGRAQAESARQDKMLSLAQARQALDAQRFTMDQAEYLARKQMLDLQQKDLESEIGFKEETRPFRIEAAKGAADRTPDLASLLKNYGMYEGELKENADQFIIQRLKELAAKDPVAGAQAAQQFAKMRSGGFLERLGNTLTGQ